MHNNITFTPKLAGTRMTKTVVVDEVGEITLRKIKNAKRISLKVKQTGQVVVTMPYLATFNEAIDFALQQKDWILDIHQKVKKQQQSTLITAQQNNVFSFFSIQFVAWEKPSLKVQFKAKILTLFYPEKLEQYDPKIQQFLKEVIGNILRMEARKRLPEMLERLAKKHKFSYSNLTIRKSATRWGSCSSQKSINLSVYLMLLPDELIEYVILHELCHTLEMNHGPRFYYHMDRVTGGRTQALRRKIRQEGAKWNFLKQKNTVVE